MYKSKSPKYPSYIVDDREALPELTFAKFNGMQIRNGPYGALSSSIPSNGAIDVSIQLSDPGNPDTSLFKWLTSNQEVFHNSLISFLGRVHPGILALNAEFGFDAGVNVSISNKDELHKTIGIVLVSIRSVDGETEPKLIVEVDTDWHYDSHFCVIMKGCSALEWTNCNGAYTEWYR